jgi:uncharacterized membrane protein
MLYKTALFLHLIGFAAYVGASFAQARFMGASKRASIAAQMRDTYEELSASIITRIALPGIFLSFLSGLVLLYERPFWLRTPALHVKLTVVLVLLVLTHFEMFNARKIAKVRNLPGEPASAEIAARKGRQGTFNMISTLGVLIILVVVSFGLRP